MEKHSHSYAGTTTFNAEHIHHFGGITSKAQSFVPHTHFIKGDTTYNFGHDHPYYAETGPAIPVEGGGHTHYFYAIAELEDGHIHYIEGYTSVD